MLKLVNLKYKLINVIIFISILSFSLFVFTFRRDVELCGGDDFNFSHHYIGFAKLITAPADFTIDSWLTYVFSVLYQFFFLSHGATPGLYFGIFYKIIDIVGIPYSIKIIHLPIALFNATTCFLLYLLLVRCHFNRLTSLIGTVYLIVSPLYSSISREITTSWLSAIVFNFVVALLALRSLSDRMGKKIFASFALVNIVLSDNLFFLTIPALVVAFSWNITEAIDFSMPKAMIVSFWKNTKLLQDPVVFLPACVMAFLIILKSLLIFLVAKPSDFLFFYDRLLGLYVNRGEGMFWGFFMTPVIIFDVYYEYMAMILGELFPFAFLLVVIVYFAFLRGKIKDFVWLFATISGIGYGVLFYVLHNMNVWVKTAYQIYAAVPILLIFLWIVNTLIQKFPQRKYLLYGFLGIMLVSGGMGHLSYVWRMPLYLRTTTFAGGYWGKVKPNDGTKAVGYLVREILKSTWKDNPIRPVNVFHQYGHEREMSFRFFSGIGMVGEFFEKETGIKPIIRLMNIENAGSILPVDVQCYEPNCVIVDFGSRISDEQFDESRNVYHYVVVSHAQSIAHLIVLNVPHVHSILKPGSYSLCFLERQFDQNYREMTDLFPLPVVSSEAIKRLLQ